ncbi:hypothetical protein BJF85_00200 [Saccharomonospora sp. CUA-673]|uniref:helix-turn-helix domain-containing protein n=1 Tax=Saccharomonospora sp. CUA-673 TaxID=1904969 RepID=UPI000968321A|nr:helix-turn-helix domain-containing protein [Saccharomonospora sp. CUA-673]OLT46932.1 hypothetical protein BJF85_00200 [Saccharomonospora sp. CUA-673]
MATRVAIPNRQDRRSATYSPKRYASLQAGSDYLDVTVKSLRNWIAQGRITGYRVGRHIKVDLNELDAFAEPIPTAGDAA